MAIQRELKFKVHNFKLDTSSFSGEEIEQCFINDRVLKEERRFRKTTTLDGKEKYSYILKSKGGLERHTMPEVELTKEQYDAALAQKTGGIIRKKRFTLYYDGINISENKTENSVEIKLDIYSDKLQGLVTAEVPVADIEDAKSVYLPISLGVLENVTENPLYKNSELAEVEHLNQILFKKQYEVSFTNLIKGIVGTDLNFGDKYRQDLKYYEETGELAQTLLKDLKWIVEAKIKGTMAEELFDVIYYLLTKLAENNIDFDMDFLNDEPGYAVSYDSYKQVANYVAKQNCQYEDKRLYQKKLLNYFQMLSGMLAEKELTSGELDKTNYRTIINQLILIVFEIARVNNVDMEKAAIVKELKNSIKYNNRDSHFLVPKQEIERKYLVDSIASDFDLSPFYKVELRQFYLSIDPEKRVRQEGEEFYYTEKGDGTLKRDEPVERPISSEEFNSMINNGYCGNEITKTRYYIYFNPITRTYHQVKEDGTILLQLDIYHGLLEGKMTIETEFDAVTDVIALNSLPSMNRLVDVTEDKAFKNKYIAMNGWPEYNLRKKKENPNSV